MKRYAAVSVILVTTICVLLARSSGIGQETDSVKLPIEIAHLQLVNQTVLPSPGYQVTVFTPTINGLYRLSMYTAAQSSANARVCIFVYFTDSLKSETASGLNCSQPATGNYASNVLAIQTQANIPVIVDIFTPDTNGTATYDFFATAERL